MSELEDAITRLELAVARLEAASAHAKRASSDERVSAVAAGVAARIDAALAKLGQLLEPATLPPAGGEDRVREKREE